MRVVWSPLALERVVEVAETIRWDKPEAARRWLEKVFREVESLATHPRRGRTVPEVDRGDVRELLLGNYRLIYRLADEELQVLTVRHGRRLLDLDELG